MRRAFIAFYLFFVTRRKLQSGNVILLKLLLNPLNYSVILLHKLTSVGISVQCETISLCLECENIICSSEEKTQTKIVALSFYRQFPVHATNLYACHLNVFKCKEAYS